MNPVWHFLNGVPQIGGLVVTGNVQISGGVGVGSVNTTAGVVQADNVFALSDVRAGASGAVYFNTRSILRSPANGQAGLTNFAETAGVGLDFATDASLKIRTRAQSAFATLHGFLRDVLTEAAEATDGNVTYTTGQVLGGIITRSNMASNRVDAFPTAANLVAAIPGCVVGTSFDVLINNDDTAQTVTVNGASTGITYQGAATAIAATEARLFRVLITNVTGASEAATVFQVV